MKAKLKLASVAGAFVVGAMAWGVSAPEAGAEQSGKSAPVLYDWHAPKSGESTKSVPSRVMTRLMIGGRANYACSPSGYGQRPVCQRR